METGYIVGTDISPKMSLIHVFNLRYFRDDQDMLQSEPPTRSEFQNLIESSLTSGDLMKNPLKAKIEIPAIIKRT